jgi:hypothetical protein
VPSGKCADLQAFGDSLAAPLHHGSARVCGERAQLVRPRRIGPGSRELLWRGIPINKGK